MTIYKIGLILSVSLILIYTFQGYYPDFISLFSNAFTPIIAGAAVIVSGFSLKKYWSGVKDRFSVIWLYFTWGLLIWFMGEVAWAVYTLVLGVELPYPSFADIFWLFGYIPFFIALYWYVKMFSNVLTKKLLVLSMAATVALAIVVAITLFSYVSGTEEDLVATAVNFAYPLLDLLLFSVAHVGLIIFWRGKLGKSWLLINAGIAVDTLADILFSYTTAQDIYYSGHMLDVLFIIAYLLDLIAFYVHAKEF